MATVNACRDSVAIIPNTVSLLIVLVALPESTYETQRMFNKVRTLVTEALCEGKLEALVLLLSHRNRLPYIEDVIHRYSITGSRKLMLAL